MRPLKVPVEKMQAAAVLFADGASRDEVQRSTGLCLKTLRRHFPGTAWSFSEAASYGVAVQRAVRKIGAIK